MTTESERAPTAWASRWAFAPVLLLAAMLLGLGTMAAIALDDPSFAVESDYYDKAVGWNAVQAQAAENDRLAWALRLEASRPSPEGTQLSLAIEAGRLPVAGATVRVEAFPNARAGDRRVVAFTETSPGLYRAALPGSRPGLWEFRVTAARGADTYTEIVRLDVSGARP